MGELSSDRFLDARSVIMEYGRGLEKSLYVYHFENGSEDAVVEKLREFQNDDGGFGNALEPDFRIGPSSPLATSIGLQVAAELDLQSQHDIVRNAITYLLDTYQGEHGYWPATFEDVNDAPHAVWWHVDEVTPPTPEEWPNPSAELVGYLWKWKEIVPGDFLEAVTGRAEENINSTEIIGDDHARRYAILCWERSLPYLPDELAKNVRNSITSTLQSMDLETGIRELYWFAFARSPDSTVSRLYPERIDDYLNVDIQKQRENGGWWPTWDWGQYEDFWPEAEREWVGKLTLDCLVVLDRFGKIGPCSDP